MRTLLSAVGTPLRRDDGVAHMVLKGLGSIPNVDSRDLLQLTPEIAEDIAGYGTVIFIDSDTTAMNLLIESLNGLPSSPVFSHLLSPATVVQLSRVLYGFAGRALLCRIPVCDLSQGEGLSRRTNALVTRALGRLENLLGDWDTKGRN